ncbi:phage tail protein [Paenibacillus polymyxa]|uniref:phage tail-collar fiber domain-containing protein n=1 Tax=Paenibacillus polymyxa TaxID=1406 RepID=UPI002AB5B2D5|nr:phage tail protein [Paenibacillus polymyxa]MDY7990696.1 phage tail protein [Paenibacillus polymyxa]MDY8117492.1 phage tail protein [Paenibacillus polymyxa]
MAAFGGLVLTIKGRNLQAKVQAGQQLKFSRMGLGDGIVTSQSIPNMTELITERKSITANRVYTPSPGRAAVSAILSNQDVTTGFFFRELGVFALDPDEGEIMYAYGNSGSGSAEYIPPTGGADLIEKLINVNLLVGNATNISITTDQSLVYVTVQDLEETLQEAKTYTDTKIADVKVPDATTTQKGIVRLSADYKSQSSTTVPNSKALFDLYNIVPVDRGKVFQSNFNFALGIGVWRVDYPSLNPATDNSPPGAYPKGVLFVSSVNVTEGLALIQKYVDDTGGIYNRVRTVAGTWLSWDGLASKNYAQRNLRLERAVELGADVTGAGPAFFDFHTSGNAIDYDSRIIAEGGTTATGNGKITIQAATTALTGKVETSGQVWVAKNTQFGSSSGLSLPIGDADTGFNWVNDGNVDFYSNGLRAAALQDGEFIFKNVDGNYERLNTAINDLKQSSVDKFTKIANAINGKGGSANSGMTGDQFAAAITNLPVKRFASGTFNGQNAQASSWGMSISLVVSVGGLSFTPSAVFIRVRLTESDGFRQVEGFAHTSTSGGDTIYGWRGNSIWVSPLRQQAGGFNVTIEGSKIDAYAGGSPVSKIWAYEWFAYE